MGIRFRKSKKIGPVRFTASKSGISTSVGGKAFRVTKRADGRTQKTATLPGTGISYSTTSGSTKKKKKATKSTTGSSGTSGSFTPRNISPSAPENPKKPDAPKNPKKRSKFYTILLWYFSISFIASGLMAGGVLSFLFMAAGGIVCNPLILDKFQLRKKVAIPLVAALIVIGVLFVPRQPEPEPVQRPAVEQTAVAAADEGANVPDQAQEEAAAQEKSDAQKETEQPKQEKKNTKKKKAKEYAGVSDSAADAVAAGAIISSDAAVSQPESESKPFVQERPDICITPTGKKYHYVNCRTVHEEYQVISIADAKAKGYDSCGVCHPPEN